jgi:50S ribosomal subunit-associated GTPase HflX
VQRHRRSTGSTAGRQRWWPGGYTNAGKTTLLNRLAGERAHADQLFVTTRRGWSAPPAGRRSC